MASKAYQKLSQALYSSFSPSNLTVQSLYNATAPAFQNHLDCCSLESYCQTLQQHSQLQAYSESEDFTNLNPSKVEQLQSLVPLFNTQISLDKMEDVQLLAMCHLLNIHIPAKVHTVMTGVPKGQKDCTAAYWLRVLIGSRIDKLRIQDELFRENGIENLSDEDLLRSNIDRGLVKCQFPMEMETETTGTTPKVDRAQLQSNLDLWVTMNYEYRLPVALIVYTTAMHHLRSDRSFE